MTFAERSADGLSPAANCRRKPEARREAHDTMDSVITTATQTEAATTEAADKAAPVMSHVDREVAEYLAMVEMVCAAGQSLGNEALQKVAAHLGKFTNKYGRPTTESFTAMVLALSSRNLSMNARITLAQTANKYGPKTEEGKVKGPFALRAKAGAVDGGISYKLNMPAQFEATIG